MSRIDKILIKHGVDNSKIDLYKEIYNKAIEDSAKSVTTKIESRLTWGDDWVDDTVVDKESILKLKL